MAGQTGSPGSRSNADGGRPDRSPSGAEPAARTVRRATRQGCHATGFCRRARCGEEFSNAHLSAAPASRRCLPPQGVWSAGWTGDDSTGPSACYDQTCRSFLSASTHCREVSMRSTCSEHASTGAGTIDMAFDPGRPFIDHPDLPPASETGTRSILRMCIATRAALAELRVSGSLIPNQVMLINPIPLLEAQASSEIENIVTTAARLFCHANDATGRTDPAAREALRYRCTITGEFSGRTGIARYPTPAAGWQARRAVPDPEATPTGAGPTVRHLAPNQPPERCAGTRDKGAMRPESVFHRDRSSPAGAMGRGIQQPLIDRPPAPASRRCLPP